MTSLIFSASNITIDKVSSYQATKGLNASFPTTELVPKGPLSVQAIGLHSGGVTVTSCWITGRANWIYNI